MNATTKAPIAAGLSGLSAMIAVANGPTTKVGLSLTANHQK